ncbi:MAG: methylmalonyl Co-A mutase-associated GTPase MeaB [Microthrixaceae bacterium]|nr:methylmalonyl Co-A mutase-associated GTPase MeaB [Microthrixaceae bacterium]
MAAVWDVERYVEGTRSGDRAALARTITLIESSRPDHRELARQVLAALMPFTGRAHRVGITGVPGVGKSTFIDQLGVNLTAMGHRVAVLAVDPSSTRTGGSILGDKTRMERLSRLPNAFIRPSPSQTHLGGVARRTREAVALCEAAGFDVVMIETVGVGQSETVVAELSDVFVLLLAPAGGDELQGVKRGIMEAADLIVVNKADGDLKATATRTCADYAGALRLLRARPQDAPGFPKALTASAIEEKGLETVWTEIGTLTDWRRAHGQWQARRESQARHWFQEEVRQALLARLETPDARARMATLAERVARGEASAGAAARAMLDGLQTDGESLDGGGDSA